MSNNPFIRISIAGSGTAGLVSALLIRSAFPDAEITVVSSSQIGIIGVGEGSTEHWRNFMDTCEIPLEEMIVATKATHKYGIRFENWTTHTPDYFHSVSGSDDIFAHQYYATYLGHIERKKMLTSQTSSIGLVKDKISRRNLHKSTNQYHFDTYKLNEYLTSLAFKRQIRFIDDEIETVITDDSGIKSAVMKSGFTLKSDFWIDATGFSKVLISKVSKPEWQSFSKYLLCDRAVVFQTPSDPNGRIRSYTRARAASSGWIFEIPTQERRGNGYVFSSKHITDDEARKELSEMTGYDASNARVIAFDAGYIKEPWVKNCCAIGLSSSFVEPLEATSIGSTIQQVKMLIPYIASFTEKTTRSQRVYNKCFQGVMNNLLTMIRLHYYSDREDTPFWSDMKNMPVNEELQDMIDLWGERGPTRDDFATNHFNLFGPAHFTHVAQGQGLFNAELCGLAIDRMEIRKIVERAMDEQRHSRIAIELVDHAEALKELETTDGDWQ
jgi:tryptophan halogenase